MLPKDVIRAWKDEDYRLSLSESERALLPQHPAGLIELSEADLETVAGGNTERLRTVGCCEGFTSDFGDCAATLIFGTVSCAVCPWEM